MSAQQRSMQLAKALPPRLIRFFQKYPPPALFPHQNSIPPPPPQSIPSLSPAMNTATISTTPPTDANSPMAELSSPQAPPPPPPPPPPPAPPIPSTSPRDVPAHAHNLPYANPFLPRKNFTTGRWQSPTYGLRKQADLVKLAVRYGVVDLLPWTIKKPGEKEARRIERGLRVKGTGEGQKVKGKKWERMLQTRQATRKDAMINMPALIEEWKWKGHGRFWKKWPSGKKGIP